MKESFSLSLLIFVFSSCTDDQLPKLPALNCPTTTTYNSDIKTIIDNTCAYEGCHGSGFAFGNFTSFEGMQSELNSGSFETRTVELKDMPPSDAPSGKPSFLTAEELEMVRCWIADGYLEN